MFKHWQKLFSLVLAIVLALAIPLTSRAAPGDTTRVSLATDGTEGNNDSYYPAISADGRYVAFDSKATNLVSGDTNGYDDIFVHDTQSGTTTRVSLATDGTEGNDASRFPAISADGRYVAFTSVASNLVSGDTNGSRDIFVHDTQSGTTTRVSLATNGTEGNSASYSPAISADGRYVVFDSVASNLVSGDTNGTNDVFVHDTQTGTTTRVSLATDGTEGNGPSFNPAISADGRYVAFTSVASNLVSGDTNGSDDIFVHDTQTGTTTRVSLATDGTQGNNDSYHPAISADGRYVAFWSTASNLVSGDTNGSDDIFVHDTQTGTTTRVSLRTDGTQGNGSSSYPSISADGRYVAFSSEASNMVSGDTNGGGDIFVHDTQTGTTTRVSLATDGTEGNGGSHLPSISADGRYVAFISDASNLVSGDTNGDYDVFVHENDTVLIEIYLPMVVRGAP
jgi:Tol biopolymer transport system component